MTSFDVGDLECDGAVSVTVSVSWETENATAVDLAVDTAAPLGFVRAVDGRHRPL